MNAPHGNGLADEWALRVRDLSHRYGPGCPRCLTAPAAEPGVPADADWEPDPSTRRNACAACGSVLAVDRVSFELHRGEVLGIVGESGSGKSTLLDTLSLELIPSAGELRVAAFDGGEQNAFAVNAQARRAVRNLHIGRVYQNPARGLRLQFSAVANIAEGMIAAGIRRVATMQHRARDLLDTTQIPTARMREQPARFSGGMQQRVQIAKALANHPPILLLDEVTTGLDLSVQARVLDLIAQIKRTTGVAMVLVSHDLAVVRMLADRTLVLLDGRVVEAGLTDQVMDDPQHPFTQTLVHSLL